jgi:hypothetical protein
MSQNLFKLGQRTATMANIPDGQVIDKTGKIWDIKHNGQGLFVLKTGFECHPEFLAGMDAMQFVSWLNDNRD